MSLRIPTDATHCIYLGEGLRLSVSKVLKLRWVWLDIGKSNGKGLPARDQGRSLRMRQAIYLLFGLFVASPLWGQSTISDRPVEFRVSNGLWGALLPAYQLGTNANAAPAFRDSLDNVGYIGDLQLLRRFLGTRTSFETRGFFAFSESTSKTGLIDIDVPNPASGASNLLTGGRTHLKSKANHYGIDVALRDTWRTQLGGLSGGFAFSYMEFDQKFDADYGTTDLLREKLNTTLLGGKGFVGWDGRIFNCPTNIDLLFGVYNMDADYRFGGQAIAGSLRDDLRKTTATMESTFTTYHDFRRYQFGFHFGFKYFMDMPSIKRAAGSPATPDPEKAFTLRGMIQILL
jgi:hypothetical protein